MQPAFDTSLLRSIPIENALAEISNAGYTHIEIGLAHFNLADSSDDEARLLKAALSKNSLQLAALCGIYPLSYPEDEVRVIGVEQFRKSIVRARDLNCSLIVSELNGDLERRQESQDAFEKSIDDLSPDLEKFGVTLCFEAHPGDFIESNHLAVDLIRNVGSNHLKYLYCAPHSFILGQDIVEMIDYCKDVLAYVHIADTLRPEKTFFSGRYFPKVSPHQHLLPGLGDVDFQKMIGSLKKIDYQGFLTSNPFSHFDRPLEALKESKLKVDSMLRI